MNRDLLIMSMAGPMFAKALGQKILDPVERRCLSASIIDCADSLIEELQRRADPDKPPVVREC